MSKNHCSCLTYSCFISGYSFLMSEFIPNLLRAYGLDLSEEETEDEPVVLVLSGDGAVLTPHASHCTVHVKVADARAIDPFTGDPLYLHEEHGQVQSRELVFPVYSRMGKDSTGVVQTDISEFYDEVRAATASLPGTKVKLVYTGDMKWLWACLASGGGCKNKTHFCYCCDIKKNDQHRPAPTKCDRCLQRNLECYHHHKLTNLDYEQAKQYLAELKREHTVNVAAVQKEQIMYLPGTFRHLFDFISHITCLQK